MRRWPEPGWEVGGPPGPLDARRHLHNFGYHPLRSKRSFTAEEGDKFGQAHTLNLASVKDGLTRQCGSLVTAFNQLDFFKDGKLSMVEWQDGVQAILQRLKGKDGEIFRALCEPRKLFKTRMEEIFKSMDLNGDGLISLEELLADLPPSPVVKPRDFTMRVANERLQMIAPAGAAGTAGPASPLSPARHRRSTLCRGSPLFNEAALLASSLYGDAKEAEPDAGVVARLASGAATPRSAGSSADVDAEQGSRECRAFATLLLQKYRDVEQAFAAIDVNGNGMLSMGEFAEGAKLRARFGGDAKAIFKEMDIDDSGLICITEFKKLRGLRKVDAATADMLRIPTKRELVDARRRTDVADPPPHPRDTLLGSSQGLHSFARSSTNRLNRRTHPEELPGFDPECFTPERGPGYCARGPEHFDETADHAHPRRGTGWKVGATVDRAARFAPAMPSAQARQGRELSAAAFMAYEGLRPEDSWRCSGAGAHSVQLKVARMGETMGDTGAMGLLAPKPIGKWGHSRASLASQAASSPSLLSKVL
uniref:EF-hand domain-containing protein n=1 Tax=Zooxanthella nutricula TaxID=1333877 RepID=A0A7S2INC8_9DINO